MVNDIFLILIGLIAGSLHGYIWLRQKTTNQRELKQNLLNLKTEFEELAEAYHLEKEKNKELSRQLNDINLRIKLIREGKITLKKPDNFQAKIKDKKVTS